MRGLAVSTAGAAGALILAVTLAGCSTNGTVDGSGKPSPTASGTGAAPTGHSLASGLQGSQTSAPSPQDATVTPGEAAAALTAYQKANNAVNAALDVAGEAKIESGSLLALDDASLLYAQGVGGEKADAAKVAISFTKPAFYIPRTATYPRTFFAVVDAVQSGAPDVQTLLHFAQDHAGAPWLVDTTLSLTAGKQWPAVAVGPDGLLDYSATHLDKLPLQTTDLVAADRTTLTNDNAGTSGSAFASDDVTAAEQKWIKDLSANESPASVSMTVSTSLNPLPTYLPLKDGGELAVYGTKISLHASQPGRTFTFGDQGWAKVAGTDSISGAFTTDSVWMAAAIDPPDKAGKIQKIAFNGGLVSVEH
jgi:hypothetical protein